MALKINMISGILFTASLLVTSNLFAQWGNNPWGGNKKGDPQIKSPTLSTEKPKVTQQQVEQKPKIAEPGTPQAMGDDPWVNRPGGK